MALTDYARWELPFYQPGIGQVDIHITRSQKAAGGGMEAIGTTNFRIDHRPGNPGTILDWSGIKKQKVDDDGFIRADVTEFTLYDGYRVTGREFTGGDSAGASNTDYNSLSDGYTVMEAIFLDPTDYWVVDIYVTSPEGTQLKVFQGDVRLDNVEFYHSDVDEPHTAGEWRRGSVRITCAAVVDRTAVFTMEELLDSIDYATTTDSSTGDLMCKPFYAGLTWGRSLTPIYTGDVPYFSTSDITAGVLSTGTGPVDSSVGRFQIGSPRFYETTTFTVQSEANWNARKGIWGLRLVTLVEKVADLCGFTFNAATDFDMPFTFAEYLWDYAGTDDHYETDAVDPDELCICLNALFGFNPIDGSSWSTPITISPESPVSDLLRFFTRFGMFMSCEIDSGTPVLRFRSVDAEPGTLPADLTLTSEQSTEPAPTIGAGDYVRCRTLGADGAVITPTGRSGQAIEWEVPWRVCLTALGTSTSIIWGGFVLNHNTNLEWWEQYKCFKITDDDDDTGATINPECWLFMSYLYRWEQDATPSKRYPPSVDAIADDGMGGDFWQGYYALSFCIPTNTAWGGTYETQLPVAFVMARHLTGDRINLTRTYGGVNVGNIADLIPGITTTYQRRGALLDMEATAIEIKDDSTVSITWREILATDILPLPFRYEGNQNSSSAAGGASGRGGGSPSVSTGRITVGAYEWDYSDPDSPSLAVTLRGPTPRIDFSSPEDTLSFVTSLTASGVQVDVDTNGYPVVTVDVTCLTEPTGNSPPSGSATVDGVSLGAGGEGYKTVFIRSGTYVGIWRAPDTSGDWILLQPHKTITEAGAIVRARTGTNSGGSGWQFEPNADWSAVAYMKFPIEAAICIESDFASAGTIGIPNGATIPIPLSSTSSTVAGGYNALIGIDLSGSDPDTLQVRLSGTYDVWCEVYIVTPGGWAASDIEMTVMDETGAAIGTWPQVHRISTAAGVQTLVFGGGKPVDIDRFDTSGGSLPIGVQFHLSCSVGAQPNVSLDYWRVNAGLRYRGEYDG